MKKTNTTKRARRIHSLEFKQQAVARVAAGETAYAVAKDMDVSFGLVKRWANGESMGPVGRGGSGRLAGVQKLAILERYSAGDVSVEALAKEYGVHVQTIYRWAKNRAKIAKKAGAAPEATSKPGRKAAQQASNGNGHHAAGGGLNFCPACGGNLARYAGVAINFCPDCGGDMRGFNMAASLSKT